VLFSAHLRKHLDAVEEDLTQTKRPTDSVKALRYLLEALPGITV
jgi:hypothetical protein